MVCLTKSEILEHSEKISKRINEFKSYDTFNSIYEYINSFGIDIVFSSNTDTLKWCYVENKEGKHIISINMSIDYKGSYKLNYELMKAFAEILFLINNNHSFIYEEELIEAVAMSIIMPMDKLKKDLLETYNDGIYDIRSFDDKYKVPIDNIRAYIKFLGFI